MNAVASVRMDKIVFEVCSLHEQGNDLDFWMSKTPQERLAHTELLRQFNYGYDPDSARLQRVLEVAQLSRG